MEFIFDLCLYLSLFAPFWILAAIWAWFTEETAIGQRFGEWLLDRFGLLDEEYDDDDDDWWSDYFSGKDMLE